MPRVIGFESTPNPEAVKILVEGPLAERPRSYREAPPEGEDPLATALYAIDGVRIVLIHRDFVTVGKDPQANWRRIKPKARAAIEAHREPAPDG
jgi:hypothetical protein